MSAVVDAVMRRPLWQNAQDSIDHALAHFDELQSPSNPRSHHLKWAILSVAHAAECFAKALLVTLEPTTNAFRNRNGELYFPTLRQTIRHLRKIPGDPLLPGELRLLIAFESLATVRDEITHRIVRDPLDGTPAAVALLGLLRTAPVRLQNESALEASWAFDRAEESVFRAIGFARVEDYCRDAEALLHEQYPAVDFAYCAYCQTDGITGHHCEVCFTPVSEARCPECGEIAFVARWDLNPNPPPRCGNCS